MLLFTGAGASIELGIPGMRGMAEEFHKELRNISLNDDIIGRFEKMLAEADYDMEGVIENIDNLERGLTSQSNLGFSTDDTLLNTTRAMRWEAEWFVQHLCERLRAIDAKTMWAPTLRQISNHDLCMATTNYDRSFELACAAWDVPFDDGFEVLSNIELAGWKGLGEWSKGTPRLLKIHGSTDWYRGDDGQVYKLRHPMPLYGNLALLLTQTEADRYQKMTSSLILPTREKRTTQPPYPDLITDFRTTARETEMAIFLGASLRDPDLYDICNQCVQRGIPTYFVNVDENLEVPTGVKKIVETASGFLTSTLPTFLSCGDSGFLDACSNGSQRILGKISILRLLVTALDKANEPDTICKAIDKLVDYGVMLDLLDIRNLLSNEDIAVRKFALALIPRSVDRKQAMTAAQELAACDRDTTYVAELQMLQELMESLPA